MQVYAVSEKFIAGCDNRFYTNWWRITICCWQWRSVPCKL